MGGWYFCGPSEAFAELVCGRRGLGPRMRICETWTIASDWGLVGVQEA